MNIKISIGNINQSLEAGRKLYDISSHVDGFETIVQLPDEIARGTMQLFKLRPGFELMIEKNIQPRENVEASIEEKGSQLVVSFCLSGKMRVTFRGQKGNFTVGKGQEILCFTPRSMRKAEVLSGENYTWVNIRIESSLLNTFIEGEFDQIPTDICGIMEESHGGNYFSRIGSMTPSMHIAIHQILDCPYHGFIKRMYLEGKAMELIAHQLVRFACAESGNKTPFLLRPSDIERIHEAKDILISNLEDPPAIWQLARQVGLNYTKLKRGFHQIYNTTPYRYFHVRRMERARQLLKESNMNVTEVAYEIGYSNPAHFTQAFAKHFHCNPHVYLRDTYKNISLPQ